MKKFTLIAAALLLATGAFAQNMPQFGVKGGLNLAQEVAGEASTNIRTGIHLGLFMENQIARMIDFQAELLYSMQGATNPDESVEKFDYITVPLMFKFYTGQGRRFSIDAGPQFGYMISAKLDDTNIYEWDSLNKFDASLGVGISYKLNGGFDLGLRFLGGMTKLLNGYEHKNSLFQLGAAYRF
jgi:hypothetical protein